MKKIIMKRAMLFLIYFNISIFSWSQEIDTNQFTTFKAYLDKKNCERATIPLNNDIFNNQNCFKYSDTFILVLEDYFNDNILDTNIWLQHFPWGHELNECPDVYFLNDNVKIENGILKLIAKREPGYYESWQWDNNGNFYTSPKYFKYTSGMIYSKFQFFYSKFEIRCKFPQGNGLWPTFWLYGGNVHNEIDIFDNKGNFEYQYGIIHYSYEEKNECRFHKSNIDLSQWHTYTCIFLYDKIIWMIDNEIIRTLYHFSTTDGKVFECGNNVPSGYYNELISYPCEIMNLISSLQIVSGEGQPDESTHFPCIMEIDYIKVWQLKRNFKCCIPYKLYEATNKLPTKTHVENFIKAGNNIGIPDINGDVIITSNQNVTFKAGESIDLLPGFTVEAGANFTAEIQDCNQMTNSEGEDIIIINIPDEFSPDGDGVNDKLCIEVTGATKYDIYVSDYNWPYDQYYIRKNIPIRSNHFCVWDGSCDYSDINCFLYHKCNRKRNIGFKFSNCDNSVYKTKTINVKCSNNKSEIDSFFNHNIDSLKFNTISNNLKFNLVPNPTFDIANISFNLCEPINIHLYLTNLSGNIIKEIFNQKFDEGLHNINIDVVDLAPGTYFCVFETPLGFYKIKFIKM